MIIGITMQQPTGAGQPTPEENGTVEGDFTKDGAPPAQVYVGGSMTGLENQFQALHVQQPQPEEMSSGQTSYSNYNGESVSNANDNDAEESEEDPVKLFVGQVSLLL